MKPEFHPCCGVYLHAHPTPGAPHDCEAIADKSMRQSASPVLPGERFLCETCKVLRVFYDTKARDAWFRRNRREARSETK